MDTKVKVIEAGPVTTKVRGDNGGVARIPTNWFRHAPRPGETYTLAIGGISHEEAEGARRALEYCAEEKEKRP